MSIFNVKKIIFMFLIWYNNIIMLEQNVLVVVDYQNDFVCGSLPVPDAAAIEDAVAQRVEAAYQNGDRVIFLKDTHPKTYLQTQEGKHLPVPHCIGGTKGHGLYGRLKALEGLHGSVTVEKLQFGTFDIPARLKTLRVAPKSFTVIGVATEICVISNALILKSQFRETPVTIDSGACAGLSKEAEDAAFSVARACQIEIV